MLLAQTPQYRRRNIERVLKGRADYHPCFDRHQALFIHIPKSAGRSIVRGLFDVKSVEHAAADWYQRWDAEKFDRYYKFTFVRNPWDRAVSAYTYLQNGGSAASADDALWSHFVNRFESFDDFVRAWMTTDNVLRLGLFTPQYLFLQDIFGQQSMDFVGRFERLEEGFDQLANRLGIESKLPYLNQSRENPYQEYYSRESRAIVERVYAEDIALFGYGFNDVNV